MAVGSKAGLYQNAQSASYLPLTLNFVEQLAVFFQDKCDLKVVNTIHKSSI